MSGFDSTPDSVMNPMAGDLSGAYSHPGRFATYVRSVAVSVLHEHRVVLILAGGYIVIGGLVLTILGRPWPIQIINQWFASVWACLSAAWLVWQYIKGPRHLRAAIAPARLVGALLVTALVLPTQITFQALKQSIGPVVGFRADQLMHWLDVTVHGQAPWLWLRPILAHPGWIRFIDALYTLWFAGLIVFVVWAAWTKFRALRQRALLALLLLWIGGGTIGAWAASSVGPCYYHEIVADPRPYEELLAQLDSYGERPLVARINQAKLWETRRMDRWAQFAGISAMPSMHVGLAVLFALVASQRSRFLALLLWANAIVIQVGSVILAWHYAIDGYAGAILAMLSWFAAPYLAGTQRSRVDEMQLR